MDEKMLLWSNRCCGKNVGDKQKQVGGGSWELAYEEWRREAVV